MEPSLHTPAVVGDGTSQVDRSVDALLAEYVSIDERSIEDLARFVRMFSEELTYFDLSDSPAGDWRGLMPDELPAELVADFANRPELYRPEESPLLYRPHLSLLVACLRLIDGCREELNGFTARHLDHYYRAVLGMTTIPPAPDHVDVVVELSPRSGEVLLPAGTSLSAGADSAGRERTYTTDSDLVVNRAQIGRISSLHVEQHVTDLAEVRRIHRNERHNTLLGLFGLTLGRPEPGGELPAYPGRATAPDGPLLDSLKDLAAFAESDLHLKHFELRELMSLKQRRDTADGEWSTINRYLSVLAANRETQLTITDPRDFDGNLAVAVGGPLPDFAEVPEVDTIYDLYDLRTRPEVRDAIRDDLGFDDPDDFISMMQIKVRIDGEWREINRILEEAGRRASARPTFTFDRERPGFDPTDFPANLTTAIGALTYPDRVEPATLDGYYDAILDLERYFAMTAEEFLYVMGAADGDGSWESADEILRKAHRESTYADRRRVLRTVRRKDGVDAMLRHVLGEPSASTADPALLERVRPYLGRPADEELLREARAGGDGVRWDAVERVAEVAQRNREEMPDPEPVRRQWINVHTSDDATAQGVSIGSDDDTMRWPTFGTAGGTQREENPPPRPQIGFAVGAPILALSGGRRELTVTFACLGDTQALRELPEAITFEFSTDNGWITATPLGDPRIGTYERLGGQARHDRDEIPADLAGLDAISFDLELDESIGPITAAPGETTAPTMRLVLEQEWDPDHRRFRMRYSAARRIRIVAMRIGAEVSDLPDVIVRNSDGEADPTAPFEPFSLRPATGSRLKIGHPELASKRLDHVGFRLEWMDAPSDLLGNYYRVGYNLTNPDFAVDVLLVDRRSEHKLAEASLFTRGRGGQFEGTINVSPNGSGRIGPANDDGDPTWRRHLVWELRRPDFQHGAYQRVATEKAIQLAVAVADDTVSDAADYQVNPPYTPALKHLIVGYNSSLEVRFDEPRTGPEGFVHVHPFGSAEIPPQAHPDGIPLVPAYDNEGELYIGLTGVREAQVVALLFQLAEGSADPDLEPARVEWSYASGGTWVSLGDGKVLADATRGLINSGIVKLALGPAEPTTLLPDDHYWLRATVDSNASSVADTVAIHTQAVSATFSDNDNAPDHYAHPLPAGSISTTTGRLAGIASVHQPYTSRGGRMAEDDERFATRVSERLRHKGRALTTWDYEHLILQAFPQIYKVKCIPAREATDTEVSGAVSVIVIPDIRRKLPFNSFEPKASPDLLAAIQEFIDERAPAAAAVEITNANFRSVRARFGVRFSEPGNDEFFKQLLIEDLDRFLSPWAFDEGADIAIGSKIYATTLIDFIDRRPYVDYVANLRLYYSDDGRLYLPAPEVDDDGYHVAAGRADAVLRAARDHQIDVISSDGHRVELLTGIGFMKVELDFVVG